MNPKLFLVVLLIILGSSLVLAVDVTLDSRAPNYQRGNILSARVAQCNGGSSLNIVNEQGNQVYYTIGEQEWTAVYNTDSDSSDGRYTLEVRCADQTITAVSFCVNKDGCTIIGTGEVPGGLPGRSSTGDSGGSRCRSEWVCSNWDSCTVMGQQARTCTDTRCNQQPRTETQTCTCSESWICSAWSSCQANQQYRTCTDEHNCGTVLLEPIESQYCTIPSGGTFFQNIIDNFRPADASKPAETTWFSRMISFFKNYWLFVLSPIILVLFALIFYLLFHKKKKKVYNFNELLDWVREERKMGTSKEDIRQILSEKTGWTDQEITQAFNLLKSPTTVVGGGQAQ